MAPPAVRTVKQPKLTPQRRRVLRKYRGSRDDGIMACRVQRQHWWPDLHQLIREDKLEPAQYNRRLGVWELVCYCERCGSKLTYGTQKGTGVVKGKRKIDYVEGYKLTEEEGGDGYSMTVEDRDYLFSLDFEDALAYTKSRADEIASSAEEEEGFVNSKVSVLRPRFQAAAQ